MRCIDVERDWRAKLREAPAPPLRKGNFTRHLADERCSSVAGASGACPLSVGGHDGLLGFCWGIGEAIVRETSEAIVRENVLLIEVST